MKTQVMAHVWLYGFCWSTPAAAVLQFGSTLVTAHRQTRPFPLQVADILTSHSRKRTSAKTSKWSPAVTSLNCTFSQHVKVSSVRKENWLSLFVAAVHPLMLRILNLRNKMQHKVYIFITH